jgi:hypothetical protein
LFAGSVICASSFSARARSFSASYRPMITAPHHHSEHER